MRKCLLNLQEIASRDMKLQNIWMCGEAHQRPLLKLSGFGHAKVRLRVEDFITSALELLSPTSSRLLWAREGQLLALGHCSRGSFVSL